LDLGAAFRALPAVCFLLMAVWLSERVKRRQKPHASGGGGVRISFFWTRKVAKTKRTCPILGNEQRQEVAGSIPTFLFYVTYEFVCLFVCLQIFNVQYVFYCSKMFC
jgi:hypothetical protein